MNTDTYVLLTKTTEAALRTIKIKASGYTIIDNGKQVKFEDQGNAVAIFNMAEIVGFVKADHMVN